VAARPSTHLQDLAQLLADGNVVALTGAGLSTESGIPDYRGPTGSMRRTAPMTFQAFIADPAARHRYWARSYLGWPKIAAARPNSGHLAVAALRNAEQLSAVITQNVDGLHQAAGTTDVVALHGGLDRTICLTCGALSSRSDIQAMLRAANPDFDARVCAINPDGDAELRDADLASFTMVNCRICARGPLKPDVVFFGETVPRDRVERCYGLVEASAALLVLGSSLTVMSGYRFVRHAAALRIRVGIVNQGPTRGDVHADIRLSGPLGDLLTELVRVSRCLSAATHGQLVKSRG
jgi:NAD-dependent SIR2 family protein deacetylase